MIRLSIWKGRGWIAPAVFIAVFFDIQWFVDLFMGDGFYQDNRWIQIWSVVSVSVMVGLMGYVLSSTDPDTIGNAEQTSPFFSHTFLFLPLEFWAVLIPCSVLAMDYVSEKKENQIRVYLENPQVNDIYSVDFAKIFKGEDPIYRYGTMVVASVDLNVVEVHSSTHAYDGKSGVRKDIHTGKAQEAFYYTDAMTPFTIRELLRFYKDGAIFSVTRE